MTKNINVSCETKNTAKIIESTVYVGDLTIHLKSIFAGNKNATDALKSIVLHRLSNSKSE